MNDTKLNKVFTPRDFGAVGDGVTDDTVAIQKWAAQKERRVLDRGIYLVSTPILFTPGGGVIGEGGELRIADNFDGYSLLVCKATEDTRQFFTGLTVDMNNVDTFILSEKESEYVHMGIVALKNTHKGFDVPELQIWSLVETTQ